MVLPTYIEKRMFHRVEREINEAIAEIRKKDPEAAAYLEEHIVMDEKEFTFTYTGDDRIQLLSPIEALGLGDVSNE